MIEDNRLNIKNKVTFVITIFGFLATVAGYGVSIGRLSQRVDELEIKTNRIETTINDKLETTIENLNRQTVQIAVLSEKVDQLKTEIQTKRAEK